MVPEFENVAFTTPVGQVSDMFRTVHGWHMFVFQLVWITGHFLPFFSSVLVEV